MDIRGVTESARAGKDPAGRQTHPRWPQGVSLLFFLAALGVLATVTGLAKEKKPPSKTVSGVVFDAAGKIIDGATVELKDLQTGNVLDIYSQEGGQYQFAGLSFDHDYKVKAMYKGASSEERQISSLDMRARPVMNLTLAKAK